MRGGAVFTFRAAGAMRHEGSGHPAYYTGFYISALQKRCAGSVLRIPGGDTDETQKKAQARCLRLSAVLRRRPDGAGGARRSTAGNAVRRLSVTGGPSG